MDTTALLQKLYTCYREKRLAEAVALLSDDFKFRSHLPDDPFDPLRPRSRAELTLLAHRFFEEYDILSLEPATIIVGDDGTASALLHGAFRHKKSNKVIEANFQHDWRFTDGKLSELHQHHDSDRWLAFLNGIGEAP